MKACCFFGHKRYGYEQYRESIKSIIVELIEKYDVGQFYTGGRGEFDAGRIPSTVAATAMPDNGSS